MTETISFVLAQPSGVGTRIRPLEPAQLRNLLPRLLPPLPVFGRPPEQSCKDIGEPLV